MSSVVEQAKKLFTEELDEATKTILDRWEEHVNTIGIEKKGGPGSGHRGHSGLPGVHGGSRPGKGYNEKGELQRVTREGRYVPGGKETIGQWLKGHKVERTDAGLYVFYYSFVGEETVTIPKVLEKESVLEHDLEEAKRHARWGDDNEILGPQFVIKIVRLEVRPSQIDGEMWAYLREDIEIKEDYIEEKQLPITDEDKAKLFQLRREMFFDRSDELAEQLFTGEISIGEWQETFKDSLRQYYSSAAAIGKGGWDEMTWADWGRLGPVMKDQYGYLQKYAEYISKNRDTVSLKYIKARARLYGEGAGFGAALIEAGTVFEHLLPFLPRDGSTECLNRCHCRWENVIFDREGQWFHVRSTWYLGEADHCSTCLSRSGRLGSPRVVVVNRVHERVKVPAVIGGY